MLHGRVVRPTRAGAKLVSVDEDSVKQITGYLKTVVEGNFVGLVAESEWSAIRAAQALKVTWTDPEPAFPAQSHLYDHMRTVAPKASKETLNKGDAATALTDCGPENRSDLPVAVPVARNHGSWLRRRRRPSGRPNDRMVRRTKAARFATRVRGNPARTSRKGAGDLGRGCRFVRPAGF